MSEPVIYGGFPGYSRAADLEAATATFLFESVTGLIGDLSARSIVMNVNYSKLWDADMPEGTISSIHPGGVSGGPVCRIDDVNTRSGSSLSASSTSRTTSTVARSPGMRP